MNKLTFSFLFCFASLAVFSQKVYFVYIQAEAEQPFFVKLNGSIHSSSVSGYIILSKLRDTTYNFSIGFPQNKWPEENFSVTISKKDHGYLLKNFGEKGWGLFDLQTLIVQMGTSGSAKIERKEENKTVSPFTDILSKASDDPSLKEKTVQPKTVEKKADSLIQENVKKAEAKAEIKDSSVVKPTEVIEQSLTKKEELKTENKEQDAHKTEEIATSAEKQYKRSVITKRSESSTTEGFGLVFIDEFGNGVADTIKLLIPNPKPVANIVKEEPKEEKKFIDITADPIKKVPETVVEAKQLPKDTPVERKTIKNDCHAVAEESDFFKLRKIMAAADGDDDMLSEARKYFKAKCFTTEQLKNISLLFLSDAGKYKFFDLSYSYVTDIENFNGLQIELKDEYYINRFKAMLRN